MMNAPQKSVLITGAASGIGQCFMKVYLEQGWRIFAADLNPVNAIVDSDHCNASTRPSNFIVDFGNTKSVQDFVEKMRREVEHLDLVIHSAGIRGLVPSIENANPDNVAAAETLDAMDAETLQRTYQINTMGTFTLLQALHRCRMLSSEKSTSKVVIMTSRMGSISYNVSTGGGYAYRASKAALNAMIKSLSIDVPGTIFALVHPGRVETGLTKCREEGAIEVEESVQDMLRLIDKLSLADSARFMDRFGVDIGW